MKTKKILTILFLALGLMAWQLEVSKAAPMGTAWTYQGRLMDDNKPMDGVYDLLFMLFNEPNGTGYQMPQTNDINDIDVIDGYFTVELDFGSSEFNGHAKWLEILVRPGDSNDVNDYVTLSPRQEVTPTPYALHTRGIFVDDGGMIGIGTTEPWYLLDVFKDVTGTWLAGFHNTGTGSMDGGVIIRAFGGDPLLVQSATENVFKAGQNGNVGIGTDNPGERLEVDYGNLLVQGNGSFDSTGEEAFVYLGDTNHYIKSEWNFGVGIGTWGVDPTLVIRDLTGHIGIGTTDPQQNLAIKSKRPQIALTESGGDTGVVEFHEETNQLRLQYWSDYGATWMRDMMVLDGNTGKVGIGTRDPDSRLDIKAASGYSDGGLRITSSINNNQVITLQDATPGDQGQITVKEGGSNKIVLRANGDTYLNGGNVGIGTASPAAKLDVVGISSDAVVSVINNSSSGIGSAVYGEHSEGHGVFGKSSGGFGVYGKSDISNGVYGDSENGTGVQGVSSRGYGVSGISSYDYGGFFSGSTVGVYGSSYDGVGVRGYSFSNYAGYFEGDVFVDKDVSALSFTDRTPYPPDFKTAYQAVMSMERLPDGQYDESDKQVQLDHSKLSDFIKSKDGNRDLSATVSCHNELLKHLIRKNDELEKVYVHIEQLNKRIIALEAKLVKMEGIIGNLQ